MKRNNYLFILILSVFIPVKLISQTHFCAHIKQGNKLGSRGTQIISGQEKYDMKFVKLDIQMTDTTNFISGKMEMKNVALSTISEIVLELHANLIVDSAFIGNSKAVVIRNTDVVKLTSNITSGTTFTVTVFYHGFPPTSGFFNGISNAKPGGINRKYTWTLSEPNNAFHWWPCKQVLTDKLDSSVVWITCDSSLEAASNGLLRKVTNLGSQKRYEWHYPLPIDYYLISAACGDYFEYSYQLTLPGETKTTLFQNFIYNDANTISIIKPELDKVQSMITEFSKLFGVYPFKQLKIGYCMAPMGGGMEHNTMVTQGIFNTGITAHELAHQWWGDHVTCKSWKDIWVNEAFATYSEFLYYQKTDVNSAKYKIDNIVTNVISAPGGRTYVTDTINPFVIFDGRLTYNKGAGIIHMMRNEIHNDSLFFLILKTYQSRFANGVAGVSDMKKIVEEFSKLNFTDFFNQWYYGEGFPTYKLHYTIKNGKTILMLTQNASMKNITPYFSNTLPVRIAGIGFDTMLRLTVYKDSQYFMIDNYQPITKITVDPDQWIIDDTGTIVEDNSLIMPVSQTKTILGQNKIRIYPNPNNGIFTIEGLSNGELIKIYNTQGKLVCAEKLNSKTLNLELTSGLYYLVSEQNRPIGTVVVN